jgi:hypothetical protein
MSQISRQEMLAKMRERYVLGQRAVQRTVEPVAQLLSADAQAGA